MLSTDPSAVTILNDIDMFLSQPTEYFSENYQNAVYLALERNKIGENRNFCFNLSQTFEIIEALNMKLGK